MGNERFTEEPVAPVIADVYSDPATVVPVQAVPVHAVQPVAYAPCRRRTPRNGLSNMSVALRGHSSLWPSRSSSVGSPVN